MGQWVRLCGVNEGPAAGGVAAMEAGGTTVCVVRTAEGELRAMSNVCPHRQAPLAEGWVEDGKLVCPWHSWTFDVDTGLADYPEGEQIAVYPLRVEDGEVLVELEISS